MGRRRIRHVKTLSPYRVLGWDVRADRRAEVEDLLGIETLPDQKAAEAADVKAAFISVPPSDHEYYIDWALNNDVSFMVEQPISHKIDRLDEIRRGVEERRLVSHVSNNHRHSARVRRLRELIASGDLGVPMTGIIEIGEWLPDWHAYEPYVDYYPSHRSMGGGLDGVCDLDWLRDLFGEVVESCSLGTRVSALDIDTNDVQQFLFRFASGPQIVLHTDMLQRPYAAALKLVFSNGVVTHRMGDRGLTVYHRDADQWSEVPLDDDLSAYSSMQGKEGFSFVEPMYEDDSRVFLEKLETRSPDLQSIDDGIANLRTIYPLVYG